MIQSFVSTSQKKIAIFGKNVFVFSLVQTCLSVFLSLSGHVNDEAF